MKFYLSSFGFGSEIERLKNMLSPGSILGHVNNSQDISDIIPEIIYKGQREEIEQLIRIGFKAEPLDLRNYFGEGGKLREKLFHLDGVWVSGGNTFVLRQAMKLSGFDIIFNELRSAKNFLYAGYSAGICVLCDSLKYIQNVDNPNLFPYRTFKQVIWEGLNVFNYGLLPHYDSDHHESNDIDKDVQDCIDNKWLFKALRDGEVIILEE
jgi:dipeptidase E